MTVKLDAEQVLHGANYDANADGDPVALMEQRAAR